VLEVAPSRTPGIRRPAPGVKLIKNVRIPMHDGVRLAADLYVPDDDRDDFEPSTPLPVVMDFIPYRKDEVNPSLANHYLYLARHDYILARVDIRGTGASEGANTDEYTRQEQTDGAEAIEWFAAQPWCDGHVNMIGISYGGFTALQVAALKPPHLTSIIPVDFTDDRYTDDCHYRGGLLRMYYDIGWYGTRMIAWNAMPPDPESSVDDWAAVWERHIAENEPYLLKWLEHQTDGPYWRNGSVGDGAAIDCPAFLIGGWRDGYPNPPLRLYRALASRGLPVKVLVGPWNHAFPDGAIPGPRIDYLREVVRWLDHWCKGASNGVMDDPPVVVYMQASEPPVVDRLDSAGEWRAESTWPAPGGSDRVLHLAESGRLTEEPGRDGEDVLAYHPAVGVTGGLWSGGIQFGLPGDQRPDEALSAVYTTRPLDEELAILGWAHADLVVASSAAVVGFAVSLSDVAPDGSSHLIAKGMLNVTRRASLSHPTPLTPGQRVTLSIDLDCAGWIFAVGHRVRVAIANADFPNVWPTPQPATSTLFYGAGGSRVTLAAVPRKGSATPPDFAPSPLTIPPHASAVHPPTWKVTTDVLTGRVMSDVRVEVTFRATPETMIEREFAAVSQVDPADPAHASAHGWHVNRTIRANQTIEGRCDSVIQSTATHFHVTIDLEIRVNDRVHATRRWTRSIERQLL
jgi:putative CocE/NonD family hydrolase